MSILCFLSIHLFVCLFVATELSQTVATSRRDLLSAIVFVAEHPINHNFPFMISQTQSITIFYRSPFMVSQFTFEVKDISLNHFFKIPNKIKPLHCFSRCNLKFASSCLCRRCLVVCLFKSRRLSEIEGKFGGIRSFQTSDGWKLKISAHLASGISWSFLGAAFIKISLIGECCLHGSSKHLQIIVQPQTLRLKWNMQTGILFGGLEAFPPWQWNTQIILWTFWIGW